MAAREHSPTTSTHPRVRRDPSLRRDQRSIVVVLTGAIDASEVARVCASVRSALVAGDVDLIVCDVGEVTDPDVSTVDALARLQLTVRRLGREVRLRHASSDLRRLAELLGLCDVLGLEVALDLGSGREAEEREQPRGVEEERDPADPTI